MPVTAAPTTAAPRPTYARPATPDLAGLAFMVINGRIARVDVGGSQSSPIKTVSGIGIGNTETDGERVTSFRARPEACRCAD